MKAVLHIDLKTSSPEEGQRILFDLCEKLKQEEVVEDYRFEIETTAGPVTEKCVLSDEKVIA
jgi:phosphoribosylformylglycinamidine (FGAM) synthase PurS component